MKRSHDDQESSDPSPEAKRVRDSDVSVLLDLKDKYARVGSDMNEELERAKQTYLISYLKRAIKQLPMSEEIINASEVKDGYEGFLNMYSLAKTCVHMHIQIKKVAAFNAIYDMLNGLLGQMIHDRFVSHYFRGIIPEVQLQNALINYQEALKSDDNNINTELHCVAYLIQTEMDKKEPLKVPNPMYNRLTQQMKAVSKYITTLLAGIATKSYPPPNILLGSKISKLSSESSKEPDQTSSSKGTSTKPLSSEGFQISKLLMESLPSTSKRS